MPNTYLDSLSAMHGGFLGTIRSSEVQRDFVLWALMQDQGIVIYNGSTPISGALVYFVNAALLNILKYADLAAYQAALALGTFVHPDDLVVSTDHVVHASSATYDVRLLRGDNGQYRKVRVSGLSFVTFDSGPLRLASIHVPL